MKEKQQTKTVVKGLSFGGALTIAFIVLKILKIINWSWIWVLAPLWIELAASLIIIVIFFAIVHFIQKKEEKEYNDIWGN